MFRYNIGYSIYVFNPGSETTELLRPIIEKGFGENRYAISFIETISEEWGKYLESKEANETENPFNNYSDQ